MSNRDPNTQPKMRHSVQVGYRRLARPVVWPVLARASTPAETPESPPVARTFPWGMMERVRQALAEEPAPPAPASRWPKERPIAAADAEPQVRRQVVVEEASARPHPAASVPTELGDLPAATPDAEPDSGPFPQAQPEPEEEGLNVAQAAPPGMDQATPSDPSFALSEADRPAWDDRSEPADRQSSPQPEQAAPGPSPAEAVSRPSSAAESSRRAGDMPHTTAVQRAVNQGAPATAPAAGDGQAAEQPGVTSLPPAYPAGAHEEQPASGAIAPTPFAGGEVPAQLSASREPESPPATAGPQLNLRSDRRDPWAAFSQPAQPAEASSQIGEEPLSQAVPAAEAGSVQRMPEGRPEAPPGDRAEPALPPQAAPGTQSGPVSQMQAQSEGTVLRRADAPRSQAEPGEGDTSASGQSEWTAAAPTLAEAIEGVRVQPAEVGQESAEVGRASIPPTEARQEPAPPTEVRQRPVPPVEVRRGSASPTEVRRVPVPPSEARQGSTLSPEARQEPAPPTEVRPSPVSPVEAKQEAVPPTEVRRMPAPPADAGLVQRSPAPRAQPPVGDAQPSFGTLSSAKRQTRKAPGAAGETVVSPGPESDAWGGSTPVTRFDAPAVVQTQPAQAQAEAADESTAPVAVPPSSGSSATINSAPPAADVDTLARQVYQILRRRLQVEYERNLGHGR